MLPFFILKKCKNVFSLFCCGSPVEAKGTLRRGLSQGSGWAHVMQAEGWGGGSTPEFGGARGGAPGECAVGCQRLSERFCFRSARRRALCPPGRGCRGDGAGAGSSGQGRSSCDARQSASVPRRRLRDR